MASILSIPHKDSTLHGQSDRTFSFNKSTDSHKVQFPTASSNIGTALAHEELFNLIVLSANEPDMSPLFNVASSAWNNAFFMMGIVPPLFNPTPLI
jgi:hypothetical protein